VLPESWHHGGVATLRQYRGRRMYSRHLL
jgi:hypothetical protein